MTKDREGYSGVWRTIRGTHVFIRDGEDLDSAMRRSGKATKKLVSSDEYNEKLDNEYKRLKNGEIDTQEYLKTTDDIMEKYTTPRIEQGRETRAREIDKINEGTPLQDMANDRIKEKQNTLANDKAMLEGMKRNGINEVQGWTQKDFENRIKKNEDYLNIAKGDTYINKMGTKVDIVDIDDKGQTLHKFTRDDGSTDYKTYNKSDVESMLKHNEYVKTDSTGTLAGNKEDQKIVNAGYLKSTNIAKEQYEPKYSSVVDRYNRDENFRNMLKQEHEKTIETTKKEISSYFDMTEKDRESLVGGQDDLYKAINEDYGNINREEFDRLYRTEELKRGLSRPYVEQPDGTYADPKSPFTKRTSSELRKQIKELEPYTEELQVGNRVIINTGGGRYGVRNVGDEDDPMTDYSAYVYGFNAKSIIQRAREQGIVTDTPKTSKTTEAKVERFKERKGKSNSLESLSKRELAEKIVENQIARGMNFNNKDAIIKDKMKMTKSDLLNYFK